MSEFKLKKHHLGSLCCLEPRNCLFLFFALISICVIFLTCALFRGISNALVYFELFHVRLGRVVLAAFASCVAHLRSGAGLTNTFAFDTCNYLTFPSAFLACFSKVKIDYKRLFVPAQN